ncbi:GerMN domain-containing protein [Nocardioides hwasunensis]|uniref:GerMN domain-containing protein n=1 Tax=Nocardioides hwasunensis TaxID=397258 RepID=A0ABR8MJA5_9ACTN|nr:GerMN domain-containing protein [Nocardioides hwasunensis]MBD3916134.1 GerMN domain-containing protein [Nocardioides hwasunensis]
MNDQLISDLLLDVADDIEPDDRLDAIRAATRSAPRSTTASSGRRTRRGWWAAGGFGLVAASVVAALALTTGGSSEPVGPAPAGPTTSDTTATDDEAPSEPVAVYFVGDTADGPRLYREFQPAVSAAPAVSAIDAALRGDSLDPDYRSAWPAGVVLRQWIPGPDVITVILDGAPAGRPAGMSEGDARLALEQLVRTAQAVQGQGKVPVDVQVEGQVTDTVLGVRTTAPLTGSPDADVLAPVSLSDPSEGLVVAGDETIRVRGRGSSPDGSVQVLVQRWESTATVADRTIRSTLSPDRLTPFAETFALPNLPPGDYDVIARVRNADGTVDSDTRRITVTD